MLLSTEEKIIEMIAKRAKKYDLDIHLNYLDDTKKQAHLLFVNDLDIEFILTFTINKAKENMFLQFVQAEKDGKHFKNQPLAKYDLFIAPYHFEKEPIENMLLSIDQLLKKHTPERKNTMGFR